MITALFAGMALAACAPKDAAPAKTEFTDVGMTRRAYADETRRNWTDDGPRPLATLIWYPAAEPGPGTALDIPENDPIFRGGAAQRGAPPRQAKAPLVVMSHGTGGAGFQMMWLGRRLAERGYIVAAVDHHGNTGAEDHYDPRGFRMIWERPRDLSAVIDAVLADEEFGPLVDRERIGVAGFSLGGYAATAVAGGRFSPALNETFCAGPDADFTCEPQPEFEAAADEFQKLLDADPGLAARLEAEAGADYRDPRVRAAALIAPALGRSFTPESLAAVDAPMLVVVGENDAVAPAATNAQTIAEAVAASRYETVPGAGHYTFLNPCTKKGRAFVEFCKDAKGVDRDGVHEKVAAEIGDFFDTTLHPASGWGEENPGWTEPYEPFRVIGNIYSVGPCGLGVYLIATHEGHILLDGGLPETVPLIARNIEALGFRLSDVKILLNSHAHFDHSGGLAALKALTGATLIASEGDRSALEGGVYLGSEEDAQMSAPPVAVDETVADGGTASLGGAALTANLTPGHTRGCTSWSMTVEEEGKPYSVLFFCSASVAANRLADPEKGPQYEGVVEDYRRTFEKARAMRPDVLLAGHPEFFGMEEKRARQKAGDPLAFVDPEAFPALIARQQADFEKRLAEATAAQ